MHAGVHSFDYFFQGRELFRGSKVPNPRCSSLRGFTYVFREQGEEMTDRLRFFAEECDSLRGIQCLIDVDSVCSLGPS